MPTPPSPRVNVVVTPDQHRYLMAIARHQNRSAASLVREMIDAAEPLMKRTVHLLELTEEANATTRQTALDALKSVLEELSELAGTNGQQNLLDLLPGASGGEARAEGTGPSAAREDASDLPPSSNTGVQNEQDRNKRQANG